jgi:hypothetical protein
MWEEMLNECIVWRFNLHGKSMQMILLFWHAF